MGLGRLLSFISDLCQLTEDQHRWMVVRLLPTMVLGNHLKRLTLRFRVWLGSGGRPGGGGGEGGGETQEEEGSRAGVGVRAHTWTRAGAPARRPSRRTDGAGAGPGRDKHS